MRSKNAPCVRYISTPITRGRYIDMAWGGLLIVLRAFADAS